jgi:pimeloyl-ACP methyl ester carboxylesterase
VKPVRNQRMVQANGVDLCVETFGEAADPPILLIMGAAASMDWWPVGFCERLSAQSRYVIRYDLRDTGQSSSYEPGAPSYTSSDLVDDAIGLLDTLGIPAAHLVGMSMGGGIAQHLAFEHPRDPAPRNPENCPQCRMS